MLKKALILFSLFFIVSCHHTRFHTKKYCCRKGVTAGHAVVNPIPKGAVSGELFLKQIQRHQVQMTAHFKGLKPNQKFGFHVHEFGNCKNKALIAGGHLNPKGKKHGGPQDKQKHLGDLGNLSSDAHGKAKYSTTFHGRVKKYLGRSVIVHALPDDLNSQPTGNSGDRIACGVIVAAQPTISKTTNTKHMSHHAVSKTTTNAKGVAQPVVSKTTTNAKGMAHHAVSKTTTNAKGMAHHAVSKTTTNTKGMAQPVSAVPEKPKK